MIYVLVCYFVVSDINNDRVSNRSKGFVRVEDEFLRFNVKVVFVVVWVFLSWFLLILLFDFVVGIKLKLLSVFVSNKTLSYDKFLVI